MDLRMFIDLFQEIEVENLFKALDLCMEYANAIDEFIDKKLGTI